MIWIHEDYYLISPSQKLLDHLNGIRAEYALEIELLELEETQVWVIHIVPGLYFIQEPGMKLMFLANLWDQSGELIEGQYRQLLTSVVGDPPYDLTTFDEWWELRRIQSPDDFWLLARFISFDGLNVLGQTEDSKLNHWLRALREAKKSDTYDETADNSFIVNERKYKLPGISPRKLLGPILHEIAEELFPIRLIAQHIKDDPTMDRLAEGTSFGDMTYKELLASIADHSDNIHKILKHVLQSLRTQQDEDEST